MIVFFITRVTPGGPLEAALQKAAAAAAESGRANPGAGAGAGLSEEQKEQLKSYYGFDQTFFPAYLTWLGVLPRETQKEWIKWEENETGDKTVTLKTLLPREQWTATNAYRTAEVQVSPAGTLTTAPTNDISDWKSRAEPEKKRVVLYRPRFQGLLQGDFGVSTRYNDPVISMIKEKLPISIFYGLVTFLLTYLICVPLGVLKAIKHRTWIDNLSSLVIFIGYAVPGYVLGSLLVVFVAARWGWFPSSGFVSDNFSSLSWGGKIWDVIHHAVLPLICYMIGSFAFLTMLMKNNLLDQLASDYVRTAVAKGASPRRSILGHALRNSLIPIVTTLGGITTIFLSGSILVEKIFDINGFGMLSYQAILDRDYPLVMAVLTINVVLMMLGNLLSDLLVASTDPRIRFQ